MNLRWKRKLLSHQLKNSTSTRTTIKISSCNESLLTRTTFKAVTLPIISSKCLLIQTKPWFLEWSTGSHPCSKLISCRSGSKLPSKASLITTLHQVNCPRPSSLFRQYQISILLSCWRQRVSWTSMGMKKGRRGTRNAYEPMMNRQSKPSIARKVAEHSIYRRYHTLLQPERRLRVLQAADSRTRPRMKSTSKRIVEPPQVSHLNTTRKRLEATGSTSSSREQRVRSPLL